MPLLTSLLTGIELPFLHRVTRHIPDDGLSDIPRSVRDALNASGVAERLLPNGEVAIGVGSRGIAGLPQIVRATVDWFRERGARPFLVPCMGSHGGATAEGQLRVLEHLGVTAASVGCPIRAGMDTIVIGTLDNGLPVHMDAHATSADGVFVINRVKPHTAFTGPHESGLVKMLVIGLGHHKGCTAIHKADFSYFGDTLREATRLILSRAKVGFGVAIMENAYDQTLLVEAVPAGKMLEREAELVMLSRKNMPILMIPDIDVLVVEQIGKDISGNGYDPNILGKSFLLKEFVLPVPKIDRMVVLDVSPASHGSAVGIGIFDVTTRKLFDQLNMEAMYANDIALGCLDDCKIPLVAADEEEAIRVAVKVLQDNDPEKLKIVRIRDTLHMEEIQVSEDLLDVVRADPRLELLGPV